MRKSCRFYLEEKPIFWPGNESASFRRSSRKVLVDQRLPEVAGREILVFGIRKSMHECPEKKWSSDFSAGVDDTKKKRDGKERRSL